VAIVEVKERLPVTLGNPLHQGRIGQVGKRWAGVGRLGHRRRRLHVASRPVGLTDEHDPRRDLEIREFKPHDHCKLAGWISRAAGRFMTT
jgi:hypothetical protein